MAIDGWQWSCAGWVKMTTMPAAQAELDGVEPGHHRERRVGCRWHEAWMVTTGRDRRSFLARGTWCWSTTHQQLSDIQGSAQDKNLFCWRKTFFFLAVPG